jgi:hypothetical protein
MIGAAALVVVAASLVSKVHAAERDPGMRLPVKA